MSCRDSPQPPGDSPQPFRNLFIHLSRLSRAPAARRKGDLACCEAPGDSPQPPGPMHGRLVMIMLHKLPEVHQIIGMMVRRDRPRGAGSPGPPAGPGPPARPAAAPDPLDAPPLPAPLLVLLRRRVALSDARLSTALCQRGSPAVATKRRLFSTRGRRTPRFSPAGLSQTHVDCWTLGTPRQRPP